MSETSETRYVIWSIEHTAWWRPSWQGYTRVLSEAGQYPKAEAEQILKQANLVAFHECAIPVDVIAANAPELLELVQELSTWGIFRREFPEDFKARVHAAIAKAEGR